MEEYLFFFGRTPTLSFSELSAIAPTAKLFDDQIGMVEETSVSIDGVEGSPESLMSFLGGTIKIGKIISVVETVTDEILANYLSKEPGQECIFALSSDTSEWRPDQSLLRRVKDLLTKHYAHVRYLIPRHESGVSNVAIRNEHAVELTVLHKDGKFFIVKTLAIQDVDLWGKREFDRPYADARSGMLPVKVARMVVNIALGSEGNGKTVLDPFCGMGTIVGEAAFRGAKGIGSDIDKGAVRKATGNMRWSMETFGYAEKQFEIMEADAVHASDFFPKNSIDAIVTEPFLGNPKLGAGKVTEGKEIKNIVKGLTKLYTGCLKDWKDVLKEKGKVAIAFPSIIQNKTVYSPVKSIIDTCEILGYTKLLGPLSYHRPDAIVRREFFVFEKK